MRWSGRIIAAVLIVVCLAGCQSKYQEAVLPEAPTSPVGADPVELTTAAPPEAEEPAEPVERVEAGGKIRSYLTGEMVDVKKADRRPVAVMMSNDKEALPQYGINRAAVVYEAPVEGGMNRFMAIFEDYDDLDRIGSVRSCRTYYTYFAREFDAIYAHFGQSTFAKPYLKNVDNINGLEGIGTTAYYRSKDRKQPHNAYTSGPRLKASIEKLGYRNTYGDTYRGHYQFAGPKQELELSNSLEAYKVYPGYSMNKAYFSYNEKDKLYYRFQYGGPHNGDQGQIAVKNIIFQYCPTGHYATTEYLDINVHSNGDGYFITDGKAIPVSWKKDGEFGVTHYYNTENQEIVLNRGKTWVCIIPTSDFKKTEIYGKDN